MTNKLNSNNMEVYYITLVVAGVLLFSVLGFIYNHYRQRAASKTIAAATVPNLAHHDIEKGTTTSIPAPSAPRTITNDGSMPVILGAVALAEASALLAMVDAIMTVDTDTVEAAIVEAIMAVDTVVMITTAMVEATVIAAMVEATVIAAMVEVIIATLEAGPTTLALATT